MKCFPRKEKTVPFLRLRLVTAGLFVQQPRFAEQENGAGGQVIQQARQGQGGVSLQQAQFAAGRDDKRRHRFVAGNLRQRIEAAERLQFVAEEFQPHRPRTGQRPQIKNAATQ